MLIGEVAQQSGISARMLRHYDRIGLVCPTGRTLGGYRQYSDEDVRRLFHVEGLRSLGLSLQEVAEALSDLAFDPAPVVEEMIARTRTRITQEQELLRRLDQVNRSSPAAWSDALRTIGLMRGLQAEDPSARKRLALGVSGDQQTDVVALTEAALSDPDPVAAGAISWAVARSGDTAIPTLVVALDSADAARRRRAVEALEKINSPAALAALGAAVEHDDPVVSGRAVLARGASGEADTIGALVALIVDGRYDVDAADVLGGLASEDGQALRIVAVIVDALAQAPVAGRQRLTAALAEIPGAAADLALGALVDDDDRGVALTAKAVLARRT